MKDKSMHKTELSYTMIFKEKDRGRGLFKNV